MTVIAVAWKYAAIFENYIVEYETLDDLYEENDCEPGDFIVKAENDQIKVWGRDETDPSMPHTIFRVHPLYADVAKIAGKHLHW